MKDFEFEVFEKWQEEKEISVYDWFKAYVFESSMDDEEIELVEELLEKEKLNG